MMTKLAIFLSCLILISAGCASLISVQPVEVKGSAMLPTLKDGDKVIINRAFDKLERGDIVIFLFPGDQTKSYIKRIIGLPGEEVEIREGTVFVNGTPLDEPYVDATNNLSTRSLAPVRLAPDKYFVVGDNRDNSSDSRIWGPLDRKLIYGKYVKKYYSAG